MLAAVNVHIVGGDPWWHQVIGPALIAATAIAAAWIAARTANKRHASQLAHDRELQADQLAYDREQRNRQHVLDTVDRAVLGVHSALRVFGRYQGEKTSEAAQLHVDSDALRGAGADLASDILRLGLRLGKDHEIAKKHEAFCWSYWSNYQMLERLSPQAFREQDHQDHVWVEGVNAEIGERCDEFMSACREWFEEGSLVR